MRFPKKILIILIVSFLIISVLFVQFLNEEKSTSKSQSISEVDQTIPIITSVTGNSTASAGESTAISTSFSDNVGVTVAKLFYKPASAIRWSSKSILNGSTTIDIPMNSQENWFYYITVDDAAGNGPVGSPSIDGTRYYTIIITSQQHDDMNQNISNDNGNDFQQQNNTVRHVFIEVGTKIVCSECPKITSLLNEMYKSGKYPFYYVSLPMTNQTAVDRLDQYNIHGYPSMYLDGGYRVLVGSAVQQSDIEQKITDALSRPIPKISLDLQANRSEGANDFTVNLLIQNQENMMYHGHLRVYLTEIVSTSGESNTPQRFLFHEFLINEDIEIPATGQKQLTSTASIGSFDPENIMIFAALFNTEKQTGYSQLPDKNPFDAYYVDAVAATTVVKGGNVPPAVGIQYPEVNYFHRFGYPARKSFLGKTILLGQTTIVANATDDSAITKVEFYVNGKLMKTLDQPPYRWTWHQFAVGKRNIMIKAYDDKGKSSSASMDVFVLMKWKNPLSDIFSSSLKSISGSTSSSCCS